MAIRAVENNTLLEHALIYASKGMLVFPCMPRGKEPLTNHGFKDATSDHVKIKAWWTKWPDANVAVATGAGLANFDVVDLDNEEAVREWFFRIDGPAVKTSRGCHIYVQGGYPCRGNVHPGVDYKGVGGYVLAPPSVHPDGTIYTWIR